MPDLHPQPILARSLAQHGTPRHLVFRITVLGTLLGLARDVVMTGARTMIEDARRAAKSTLLHRRRSTLNKDGAAWKVAAPDCDGVNWL